MNQLIIEAVILAFTIGGLIGATAALSLKSRHTLQTINKSMIIKEIPINNHNYNRHKC
jgi:hypothetical protein